MKCYWKRRGTADAWAYNPSWTPLWGEVTYDNIYGVNERPYNAYIRRRKGLFVDDFSTLLEAKLAVEKMLAPEDTV